MSNKEIYKDLCLHTPVPIHSQYWWMEATALGKDWDVFIVRHPDTGQPVCMLPFHILRRAGMRCVLMPAHTQLSWVWIADKVDKKAVYCLLLKQITDYCRKRHLLIFSIQGYFDPMLREAFLANGFTLKERVSYRIDTTQNMDAIEQHFSTNKKRQIKKAVQGGITMCDLSISGFYAAHRQFLSQRGKTIDYSEGFFTALAEQTLSRKQGRIIAARSPGGCILAAIFLVWDTDVCYYLLPTYNASYAHSGAMAWLTLQSIQIAKAKGLIFDFEGSMNPGIANSYRQFGSTPSTYYGVEKHCKLWSAVSAIHTLCTGIKSRKNPVSPCKSRFLALPL